ncbi:hypothetical protein AAP_05439 [Ascosphaera apis ARSEF 7405]|uniref:Uncharacterized protein n=1 Tax=Ascosphaera apis ARSEF 7405 TaxID=392613 RepID=A0A167VM98_9EURO|nr:hypothetical protein AAP_05439 [Ascosphaera apis ARSEF 7405]
MARGSKLNLFSFRKHKEMETIHQSIEEYPIFLRRFSFEEPKETRFVEHIPMDEEETIMRDMENYPYSGNIPVILSESLLPCVNATPPLPPLDSSPTPRSSISSTPSEAPSKKSNFRKRFLASKTFSSLSTFSSFSFNSPDTSCPIYDTDDFFLPEKPTPWENISSSFKRAGTNIKSKSRNFIRRASFSK